MRIRPLISGTIVLVLAGAGTAYGTSASSGPLHLVTHGDPYAACTAGAESGTLFPGSEIEPSVSVDPRDPQRVIGMFQQDRWSDGGAHGISEVYSADGRHFTEQALPFSACAPGGLNYERASDPWVSFGPDGVAYASALVFDDATARNGVAAATSYDGGRTWKHVTPVIADDNPALGNDKNSVTADPTRPGTAYQVWDRLDAPADGSFFDGPAFISITRDGGRTWSAPKVMVDTSKIPNTQTIGNIIVVNRRTGVLYDVFDQITYDSPAAINVLDVHYAMERSTDAGRTWSAPTKVAVDTSVADVDPNTGAGLRTGSGLPSVAIDPNTGELYVAYEGSDFTGGAYDQAQLVHSTDGGRTWSAPARVNQVHTTPAFTPVVAVDPLGIVSVTYNDLRTLTPGNTTTLPSAWYEVRLTPGGHVLGEKQLSPTFDLLSAPNAGGFFLGDYQGIASAGPLSTRSLLIEANSGQPDNSTDAFTGDVFGFFGFGASSSGVAARAAVSHPDLVTHLGSHLRR